MVKKEGTRGTCPGEWENQGGRGHCKEKLSYSERFQLITDVSQVAFLKA